MSRLKYSPNLFLEVFELRRNNRFIVDDGWKTVVKPLISQFGVIVDEENSQLRPFVQEQSLLIAAGKAVNPDMNIITNREPVAISIPTDGNVYYVTVMYTTTNSEWGTVNVTRNGSLAGFGTYFGEVLRGMPNFPNKVRFPNSILNAEEYEVVRVQSDTVATIVGDLKDEENLEYEVIGTFTPGFVPNDFDKKIYEYDSVIFQVKDSSEGLAVGEYLICSARFVEAAMTIEDLRGTNFLEGGGTSGGGAGNAAIAVKTNPLVCLTSINNLVKGEKATSIYAQFQTGVVVSAYTANPNLPVPEFLINSFTSQALGTIAPMNDFFAGWRLYNKALNRYMRITGNSGWTLYLAEWNALAIVPSNPSANEFVIIPDVDEVEIRLKPVVTDNVTRGIEYYGRFSVSAVNVNIPIFAHFAGIADNVLSMVGCTYRLTRGGAVTPWTTITSTTYTNDAGTNVAMSNGQFQIRVGNIKTEIRNYS
jgi:hypothetical protein